MASAGVVVAFALGCLTGCSRAAPSEAETTAPSLPLPPPPSPVSAQGSGARPAAHLSAALAIAAAPRVVAIGDLHGDLDAARRALRLASAIDASDHWTGGPLVVVQLGDEIDREGGDRAILDLFDRLASAAKATGGAVIALDGNHELMNAALDFRYVTPAGFAAFADASTREDGAFANLPSEERARAGAFAPGGTYAKDLAARPLFIVVGDTVFVHGGLLPEHVRYGLDRLNDEAHDWLRGKRTTPPAMLQDEDGPLWTRRYSTPGQAADCAALGEVLGALGEVRMVVGHTIQPGGINAACEGRVWRIDTGMSRGEGAGPVEALEIRGGTVGVLRERPSP